MGNCAAHPGKVILFNGVVSPGVDGQAPVSGLFLPEKGKTLTGQADAEPSVCMYEATPL